MCINNSKYNQLKCSLTLKMETFPVFAYLFSKSPSNVYSPPSLVHHSPLFNVSICVCFVVFLFASLDKDLILLLVPN